MVLAGIAGLAWSVLDDRERYRMLKYTYVSPADFMLHLLGRGVARVAVGAMGAIITIGVGIVLLGVPFDLAAVDWLGFLFVMVVGTIGDRRRRRDAGGRVPADPPGVVVVPGSRGRRAVPHQRGRLPAGGPAPVRAGRWVSPTR